ncbi:uncharacterized protein OCT59_008967 [Rhizophagus irregularis]|uniref:uncharacterized protein n=1 Tax=Rhizophagus irregularis TaxID=588596 RepID=UPI0019EAF4B9|nr:hypothetical protein OCT59_008967 [Rhizophagus irregularis]GBC24286.2 hypothetical protein RIR_jg656.t1 [Rhizophagus irregularis DAOM 181602=DAOM 197198]
MFSRIYVVVRNKEPMGFTIVKKIFRNEINQGSMLVSRHSTSFSNLFKHRFLLPTKDIFSCSLRKNYNDDNNSKNCRHVYFLFAFLRWINIKCTPEDIPLIYCYVYMQIKKDLFLKN